MSAAAIIVSGATIYIYVFGASGYAVARVMTHAIFLLSTVHARASSSTEGAIITEDLTLSTPPAIFLYWLMIPIFRLESFAVSSVCTLCVRDRSSAHERDTRRRRRFAGRACRFASVPFFFIN